MNWREIHDGQNLRLTQKMLEQQGEINRLRRELEAGHAGVATYVEAASAGLREIERLTSELAEVRAAASRREGYLQLQAEGQLQASSSWQREAHRQRGELEKLTNPDDADCECGEEYAEQDCPVHGVMRLLLDLRVEHAKARAEIERLREHSATLNAIAWKMGAALGDVPAGVEQIEGSPTGLTERLISEIERLRAELATPCSDIREGLFGVILTCERNLGHGGMHHDAENGAGWTYNDPSSR